MVCLRFDTVELIKKIKKRNDRKHWKSLSDKELKSYIEKFNKNMDEIINFYKKHKSQKIFVISENNFNINFVINFIIRELEKNN